MPDPNAKRDRELAAIAAAQQRQVKLLEVLNKNMVAIGVAAVPAFENLNKVLGIFNEGAEATVSTGQLTIDGEEEGYVRVVSDELAEPSNFISVLVADLSLNEVDQAGYEIHQSNVGPYIRVPRLRKVNPDGA